jgi:hypothetical protein
MPDKHASLLVDCCVYYRVSVLRRLVRERAKLEMTPEERERMNFLCEQIAKEQNHQEFSKLVQELNNLLERKEHRLEDPAKKS